MLDDFEENIDGNGKQVRKKTKIQNSLCSDKDRENEIYLLNTIQCSAILCRQISDRHVTL